MVGKITKQQIVRFHVGEVLAVDPHQIHVTVLVFADRLGRFDLGHDLGNVTDLNVLKFHAVLGQHLLTHPIDVLVNAIRTAPGVEVNRLTLGLFKYISPV